jgi:hypothetical protein
MSQNQHEGPRWKLIIALITLAGVIVTAVCGVLNGPAAAEIVKYWLHGAPTASSTTVAHVPTVTPTPSPTPHKRSNTPTFTPTITITPTSAPSPTDTPEPTATGTPTPKPAPKPDAEVNTDFLNLRSGPGVVYDILGVLKRGDWLKIKCKCPYGKWLEIICPSKGLEGWVARSLLQVNIDMAGVPVVAKVPHTPTPTLTPTPELLPPPIPLEPENGAAFLGEPALLRWQWDRPRAPNEVFSVRVRREGQTRLCHHDKADKPEYKASLSYCTAGTHYWSVALVRDLDPSLPEEDLDRWQELSESSEERWFYYVPGEEPWTWPTPDDGEPKPKEPPKEPP